MRRCPSLWEGIANPEEAHTFQTQVVLQQVKLFTQLTVRVKHQTDSVGIATLDQFLRQGSLGCPTGCDRFLICLAFTGGNLSLAAGTATDSGRDVGDGSGSGKARSCRGGW